MASGAVTEAVVDEAVEGTAVIRRLTCLWTQPLSLKGQWCLVEAQEGVDPHAVVFHPEEEAKSMAIKERRKKERDQMYQTAQRAQSCEEKALRSCNLIVYIWSFI